MREWLTVIIVLLIVTVVLDGVRRMRNNRRSALRMSPSMRKNGKSHPLDENYGSELPNGGARVVSAGESEAAPAQPKNQSAGHQRRNNETRKQPSGYRIPEQVTLNLDEQVPMLMDSVEEQQAAMDDPSVAGAEASHNDAPKYKSPTSGSRKSGASPYNAASDIDNNDDGRIEPQFSELSEEVLDDYEAPARASRSSESPSQPKAADKRQTDTKESPSSASEADLDSAIKEPEEVLVINVMAPKGERFAGRPLMETVLDNGMRFGVMDIFHHHEQASGQGGILYSMANIVTPGTFNLNTIDDFSTPGVSLFLTLPNEGDSKRAFEAMLTTARAIAAQLGGELKDENRSVMTQQTIEHCRSRIVEFERKRLSRAPA